MIYLDHLLDATHGILTHQGQHTVFAAFSHDTRQIMSGELFVAVRGEHSDGHDYLLDAVGRGAAGLLVETRVMTSIAEEIRIDLEHAGVSVITVADTRIAVQQYASAILERWHPTVIAVTGSTGKTTTKEAIARVLSRSFATFKSWQNYNDLLGLPLSLGRLEEHHKYAVLELGCDHPGEINDLCQLIRPHIGVLTNISPTQLQYFGTIERLATELATVLTCLPKDGRAIFQEDAVGTQFIAPLYSSIQAPMSPFALSQIQDIQVTWQGIRCTLRPTTNNAAASFSSGLLGAHHGVSMLAAITVGELCGIQSEEIQHGLACMSPLAGRLNPLAGNSGATLLDDTHNACPASVMAGLTTLKDLPATRRIAVLGDMLRLGSFEEEAHRMVGEKAARCVDYLITRGERAALIAEAAQQAGFPLEQITVTSTHEDAVHAARQIIEDSSVHREIVTGDRQQHKVAAVVLIKGSEETRMERVTKRLMAEPRQALECLVRQTPGWRQIVVSRAERPTWVEIDLSAISNNTRLLKALVGPHVRLLASLKGDAYGHGALKVARTVLHNGVSMLGVATASEATPLRRAGIHAPILVFGYVPPWQMREAISLGLTITLYTNESAQALSRAATALGQTVKVHVKIDTGMGRLGIRSEQIEEILVLLREINELPGIELEGIFTHFAIADASDQTYTRMQLVRFQQVLRIVEEQGLRPSLVHAANSAAAISLPETHFDMVRSGIALYGLEPSTDVRLPEGFRPALAFKTQVSQVKVIPAGESISYGCTYTTDHPTRIAVLPVGYADGFRRAPANWGSVLIHGQAAPLLGRVCMDQSMVDVSHIPQTRVGDEVVLIGRQGDAILTAEQVAERLGTINYEVVSEILARVPRVD